MYDDNYIVEAKVSVGGKKYASKDAAEKDLKSKGLTHKQIEDKLKHAVKLASDEVNAAHGEWVKHGKQLGHHLMKLNMANDKYDEAKRELKIHKKQKVKDDVLNKDYHRKAWRTDKEDEDEYERDMKRV